MNERILPLLRDLRAELERIYGGALRGVYLYGSYARGDADEGSDVDVAVVLREMGDPWREIERTSAAASSLSLKHGVSLSLYRVREAEWNAPPASPILRNIRRDAVVA